MLKWLKLHDTAGPFHGPLKFPNAPSIRMKVLDYTNRLLSGIVCHCGVLSLMIFPSLESAIRKKDCGKESSQDIDHGRVESHCYSS